MILDDVEYLPEGGETFDYIKAGPFETVGIGPRETDGQPCLTVRAKARRSLLAIPVGAILAVTIQGRRHVMRTPYDQSRLRAAELRRIIEGVTENWAVAAFDPKSPAFFEIAFKGRPIHYIDYPNIIACPISRAFRPASSRPWVSTRAGALLLTAVAVAALALVWGLAGG